MVCSMEEKKNQNKRVCPLCGKEYDGVPALSRKDNETLICPECGTREAIDAALSAVSYTHLTLPTTERV